MSEQPAQPGVGPAGDAQAESLSPPFHLFQPRRVCTVMSGMSGVCMSGGQLIAQKSFRGPHSGERSRPRESVVPSAALKTSRLVP